jgi:transcription elongation GreA/GreB family factor
MNDAFGCDWRDPNFAACDSLETSETHGFGDVIFRSEPVAVETMKRSPSANDLGTLTCRIRSSVRESFHFHRWNRFPMSRAFVKEQDVDAVEELPERPVSEHPNDVTAEGAARIDAELAKARTAFAAAQKAVDRGSLASASRDVRYWSSRRATARVIPPPEDHGLVRFGATVKIARDDGREQTFRIVGEDEADPSRGTISHVSPLARAMFGKRVGALVRAGDGEAEIVGIS